MQIRPSGTPITASQRRSYRDTPDSGFYQSYLSAYQALNSTSATAPAPSPSASAPVAKAASLEAILGVTHTELSALRGVSTQTQATYAGVLNKAYSSGGISQARQFLQSLSADELEAVRQNHCLADPINPTQLSEEGAQNLLLPEGYSVDLNHDGVDEVGAARTMHFPPRDAPVAFKEAWFQATANMDDGDVMTYSLTMHGAVYGLQIDGQSVGSNYPVQEIDSYRRIVSNFLAALEQQKAFLAEGQYARDKRFFSGLQTLLA